MRHHDHVAELAGEAVVATLQRTTAHEPAADAGAETDEQEVVDPAAGAQLPFGEAGHGVVVVDQHPQTAAGLEQRRAGAASSRR